MAQFKAEFSGGVVAEPERKQIGQSTLLEFPVYVNHTRKNRDTGEYEPTGDTTKVRVALWRDLADTDIRKGDIVEVKCTVVEKEFTKRDGSEGRALQTDYVESCVVKFRKDTSDGFASGGFTTGAAPSNGFATAAASGFGADVQPAF